MNESNLKDRGKGVEHSAVLNTILMAVVETRRFRRTDNP